MLGLSRVWRELANPGTRHNLPLALIRALSVWPDMQQNVPVETKTREARVFRPVAGPASVRRRHFGMMLSFVLLVVLPTVLAFGYLMLRAEDQYASTVAFSVRAEDQQSAIELLGGLGGLSSGSSSDTDILHEYIQSQQLVKKIDSYLDLRGLYAQPEDDIVFRFDPDGSIEDLLSYWNRMVQIFYDSGNGMIEIRVKAFSPEQAQGIAQAILDESTLLINELTEIARADTTKYARDELEKTQAALRDIRQLITEFRSRNNIIDPDMELGVQSGLLNALQQQYSDALIELDLLRETTRASDPRVSQAERKIQVIEDRIRDERRKFGTSGDGVAGQTFTAIVSEFERLSVDLQFAEEAYLAARSTYESKLAEAERQSRYLAAHIKPTLAETAEYPRRYFTTLLIFILSFLGWCVLCLIYYSVRDRR